MMITRHYLTLGGRRVHYRRCGDGPPLLMIHQSPRSSAEYTALLQDWGRHFTCIAPDTPGFGQSDPLAGEPEIADFADAVCGFVEALGCGPLPAYGFHSGGIILVTALRRRPDLFCGLAIGGYAVWTPDEMAHFGDHYLPPFVPSAYGEHLTWLWNRLLEQSWFFPWFDVRDETRLSVAHADVARVHGAVMDMLDAGDAYRAGYGAVLRAPRDIPPPDAVTPAVLISAYDGDPLQSHIDRLGVMPVGWTAQKVTTAAEHQAISLAFLQGHATDAAVALVEDGDAGFAHVTAGGFDGLLYWEGSYVDLPGFGLSDPWPNDAPTDWESWQAVIDAYMAKTGRGVWLAPLLRGTPDLLYPDLTPDRFGVYLTRAWAIERASVVFDPWYDTSAAAARPIDASALAPERLAPAVYHRLRSNAAKALHIARQNKGEG